MLDAAKGEQAVSACTARREQYCRSRGRSSDAEFVRIYDGDGGSSLNELGVSIYEFSVDAVAIASGSFFSNDDVVLSVPSGGGLEN